MTPQQEKTAKIIGLCVICFLLLFLIIGLPIILLNKKEEETEIITTTTTTTISPVSSTSEENIKNETQYNSEIEKFLSSRGLQNKNTLLKSSALNTAGTSLSSSFPSRLTTLQCPNGVCPVLGKGFDLRSLNINAPSSFPPGKEVFTTDKINIVNNSKCFNYVPIDSLSTSESSVHNVQELVNKFANQTTGSLGFPVDFASFKTTADATVNQSITASTDLQAASLTIKNEDGSIEFMEYGNCRTESLNPLLISDFFSLPLTIIDPSNVTSWSTYNSFFSRWGSHVATKVIFGSKIELWNSIISKDTNITKYLGIKNCLDVNVNLPVALPAKAVFYAASTDSTESAPCDCSNPTAVTTTTTTKPPTLNLSSCNNYTQDEINTSRNLDSKSTSFIIGGSAANRNQIFDKKVGSIPREDIIAFLESSPDSNQGIGFVFEPLWKIIPSIFMAKCYTGFPKFCEDSNYGIIQRLVNMEAAFIFNTIGCSKLVTNNGVEYQKFMGVKSGPVTRYKCWAAGEGCKNSDSDCHYSWGRAGCVTYGNSALEKGEKFPMSSPDNIQYRTKVRETADTAGLNVGINKVCVGPVPCKCKGVTGLADRYIWEQA